MGKSKPSLTPWMWVAFAPSCRLIVDFIIGPRKQYVADKLLESVSKRLKSIPLFVTDGLKFYAEAILKKYGKLMEFPKKGKRGRPKKSLLRSICLMAIHLTIR